MIHLDPQQSLTLKRRLTSLIELIYSKVVMMNMFPRLILGNSINRPLSITLGRWSTRLYIVSLVSSLVMMTLYTVIRPETLTYTLSNPSFDHYQKLKYDHSDRLECPCSVISAPYRNILRLTTTYHQVRKRNVQKIFALLIYYF